MVSLRQAHTNGITDLNRTAKGFPFRPVLAETNKKYEDIFKIQFILVNSMVNLDNYSTYLIDSALNNTNVCLTISHKINVNLTSFN